MSPEEKKLRAREATKRWRKKNPERVLELSHKNNKDAYWKNPEKRRSQVKQWRENNKERHKENNAKWRAENRDHINHKQRINYSKRLYGVDVSDIPFIVIKQGGCAICGRKEPDDRGWAIDHCHDTGETRGILCHPCNLALGLVSDNTETLRKMISYLERYKK